MRGENVFWKSVVGGTQLLDEVALVAGAEPVLRVGREVGGGARRHVGRIAVDEVAGAGLREQRAQDVEGARHRLAGDEHLRHEEVAALDA